MRSLIPAVESIDQSKMAVVSGETATVIKETEKMYHNCIPVKASGEWVLAHRPTFPTVGTDNSASGSKRGRGVLLWSGTTLHVVDETYYYSGGSADIHTAGNGYTKNGRTHLAEHRQGGVAYILIQNAGQGSLTNSGNFWVAPDDVSAPTRVTAAECPGNSDVSAHGVVSLDGYVFIAKNTGEIYNSNLNDYATWTSTDFVTADQAADLTLFIEKHHNNIAIFGTNSIQFFYNAGNATGSPLAPRRDISHSIKVLSNVGHAAAGDKVYFVGMSQDGNAGLWVLDNFQVQKIHSPRFDKVVNQSLDNEAKIGEAYAANAYGAIVNIPDSGPVFVFTSVNARGTYAVHLETGFVSHWYSGSSPTNNGFGAWLNGDIRYFPIADSHVAPASVSGATKNRIQFVNGTIARPTQPGEDTLDDIGLDSPDIFYYTMPWDGDTTSRKKINYIDVIHTASIDDGEDPANLTVQWVDGDKLQTAGWDDSLFTGGKTVDTTTAFTRIHRLGTTRQRVFKVILTPGKRQAIGALFIDYGLVE